MLFKNGRLTHEKWKDLLVGQVIKIEENESIAADVLVIYSSDRKSGKCFVETKNLDGETNLKLKQVPLKLHQLLKE